MEIVDHASLVDMQTDFFAKEGYLIVRSLFSKDEANLILDTFMEQGKDGPVQGLSEYLSKPVGENDPLSYYPRMMMPHKHSELAVGPLSMSKMLDSRVHTILTRLFADEPLAVQSMFYFKPPGARGQDLHQDNYYLRVKPGTCIAAWTAVEDADENNGGLMIVPGTQNMEVLCPERADNSLYFTQDHLEVPEGKQVQSINLKAGDVLFFNGSLIHGSSPNTSTDRFRRAFICHYVPRSTIEMSKGYTPQMDFEGIEFVLPDNGDIGPCGVQFGEQRRH